MLKTGRNKENQTPNRMPADTHAIKNAECSFLYRQFLIFIGKSMAYIYIQFQLLRVLATTGSIRLENIFCC